MQGQLCTGCGLCASVSGGAIQMETQTPGFSRPRLCGPVESEAEQKISMACPGRAVEAWPDDASRHPYWGNSRSIGVGYATDESLRFGASSGGAVTALALFALRSGLVDRVVHVMADSRHPTRNVVVVSDSVAQIIKGAGSRYASSSPLADIDRILSDGGTLAFIGKPCDASALRRLGRVDARVKRHVPLILSFFCAGIPSHDSADRVIRGMGLEPDQVTAFRYRGNGWPGKAVALTAGGRRGEMSYAESWGGHLSKEVQFRCKICPDGVGGVADIACADAWYGGESGYPTFEETDGRSLIIARTSAGEQHLKNAVDAGVVAVKPIDIDQIDLMQPSQARRKRLVRSRMAALAVTFQPAPLAEGVMIDEAAARASSAEKLRSFLGATKRVLTAKR